MSKKRKCVSVIFLIFLMSACSNTKLVEPPPVSPPPPPAPVAPPPPPPPAPPPPTQQDGPVNATYLDAGPVKLNTMPTETTYEYPVLFGTTRKSKVDALTKVSFTDQRDNKLNYGRAFVTIPKNHQVGSLGTTSGTLSGSNPKLTIANIDPSRDESAFFDMATRNLAAATKPADSYILLFIHGYNNSFSEATLRAAQLGADLGVPPNNMFLFSWAARSGVIRYTLDEATVDTSEIYLRAFLDTINRIANGRKIHIIAHSMGNRALLRVISSMTDPQPSHTPIRFGQIILAAADVDVDLFSQHGSKYALVSDQTTVYISPYDYAIAGSSVIHDYARVGCGTAPQAPLSGIDSVVSTIRTDFPAHAYMAESLPILTDVKNLILRGKTERTGDDWTKVGGYWVVGPAIVNRKVKCKTRAVQLFADNE